MFRSLLSPALLLIPFLIGPTTVLEHALIWIAIWMSISKLNYVLHNHIHAPMSALRPLNRVIDLCLGFCTGMTAMSWRLTHIHGHHVEHLVQPRADGRIPLPSRLPFTHEKYHRYLLRFTAFNAVVHTSITMWPQWLSPLRAGWRRGVDKPSQFSKGYYRWMLIEFAIIYGIYAFLLVCSPTIALFYIALPMILVLMFSRYVDFLTHAECDSDGMGFANNCLVDWYNNLYWNFGYHTAHHMAPTLHWTLLPEAHRYLLAATPAEWRTRSFRSKTYSFAGFLWPLHLLLERRCALRRSQEIGSVA